MNVSFKLATRHNLSTTKKKRNDGKETTTEKKNLSGRNGAFRLLELQSNLSFGHLSVDLWRAVLCQKADE